MSQSDLQKKVDEALKKVLFSSNAKAVVHEFKTSGFSYPLYFKKLSI